MTVPKCDKAKIAQFCNGEDVRRVRLKSRTAGTNGTNEFNGPAVWMCKECRKANCGGFKFDK